MVPGSRLLSNISETEPCDAASKVPRGYLTTEGHWVAVSPQPQILQPPAELKVLNTPDIYEKEAQVGAYMARDLAQWAQVLSWDERRTITRTLGFASQFKEGFTREQLYQYLDSIETQVSFLSFLDPIKAYLMPKLIFIGSLCSMAICCFMGAMSLHGAYRYIYQGHSRDHTQQSWVWVSLMGGWHAQKNQHNVKSTKM